MKSKKGVVLLLFILAIMIALIPIFINHNAEFKGTDDLGKKVISEIKPGYKPWAKSFINIPSSETETLFFCIQAALGAGIFGYALGVLRERSRYKRENKMQTLNEENEKGME